MLRHGAGGQVSHVMDGGVMMLLRCIKFVLYFRVVFFLLEVGDCSYLHRQD